MATHRAEEKKVPKRTREMHADFVEQQHFMATFERDNEHQTSRQPLGQRATKVNRSSVYLQFIIPT